MAKALAVPYKRFEGKAISPRDIAVNEDDNGRAFQYTKEDVADLLVDLRSGVGITQPVLIQAVKQSGAPDSVKLVAGFRRYTAASIYLKDNPDYLLPCLMVEPTDPLNALEINARENAKRKNLSVIDIGHIAVRLQGEPTITGGRTWAQIAEVLNCSDTHAQQCARLVNELPERLQRMVHTRVITQDDALALMKVNTSPEEKEKLIVALLEQAGTNVINQEISSDAKANISNGEEPDAQVGRGSRAKAGQSITSGIREAARESGSKVALKLAEFKRYLQEAIDEEGPGSNKGEVELKKELLRFIAGELTAKKMDKIFGENCKVRG